MSKDGKPQVLYLFTKQYPFGRMEKYIDHELPVLSTRFDRIVLVPSEKFDGCRISESTSPLPANVSVYDLNSDVKKSGIGAASVLLRAVGIWLYEFVANPWRKYLLKYFRKNFSILLYQLITAKVFRSKLDSGLQEQRCFYTYWFHHSSLMLSAMKSKGWIDNYFSRAHSIDLYNEDWTFIDDDHKPLPYYRYKLKHISRLFAISDHGKNYLIRTYPDYSARFTHLYLGVPDHGEGPVDQNAPLTIVTCSIFNDNKRMYLMPEVLRRINTPVRWVHFGDGGDNPQRVKDALRDMPEHVTVELRGAVPNKDVIDFYRANTVHFLVNLSLAEGVPVSIMEAISFGIPVLATRVYGSPELLANENGILIDITTEAPEIAALISDAFGDATRMLKMRTKARELFLQKVEAGSTINRFADILLEKTGK